jgi:hypothetical protein
MYDALKQNRSEAITTCLLSTVTSSILHFVFVYLFFCLVIRGLIVPISKAAHYTPWWRSGERRYCSYSVMTSALDGAVGLRAGLDSEARGNSF